jgi:hypothetical protein
MEVGRPAKPAKARRFIDADMPRSDDQKSTAFALATKET